MLNLSMSDRIYLDYNATTPIDPKIEEIISPLYSISFGNAASSTHHYGQDAKKLVERARLQVASGLGCELDEIIFTSGATESINMAIKGIVSARPNNKNHIITTKTEHKAVLDSCEFVRSSGVDIDYLPVDKSGYVSMIDLQDAIRSDTMLVIILHGNNEIGTVQPIMDIGQICLDNNIPMLVDAAQTFGKLPINVKDSGIAMLAGSSHKIYGPKGSGFLYKRGDIHIDPLIHGGGHEMGLRSGTHNVAGIVGLAVAYRLMLTDQEKEKKKLDNHVQDFINELQKSKLKYYINGPTEGRLPGNLNICLKGIDADWLTSMTPNIAVARGSACTSETIQPSHVLRAIGLSDEDANSSIRISFGRFTTKEEIKKASNILIEKSKMYLTKKESLAI